MYLVLWLRPKPRQTLLPAQHTLCNIFKLALNPNPGLILLRRNIQASAAAIVRRAYSKGSEDNLTATVVEFAWESLDESQRPGSAAAEAPEELATAADEADLDIFG